jgi:ADP-ribosylglycohydrolase
MLEEFSAELLAEKFLRWFRENHWTARGRVFDIGIATHQALGRLEKGISAQQAGGKEENSNGNGSLMRIAPLAWHPEKNESTFFQLVRDASSVTHGHLRSVLACHFYLQLLRRLLNGESFVPAFQELQQSWPEQVTQLCPESNAELIHFTRLLSNGFASVPESEIESGGYVIHSLEAALWCMLNSDNFCDAVELAVNLGRDTDTTAAICGALAGTYYGKEAIPKEWLRVLARLPEIENLAERFYHKISGHAGTH